MPHSLQQVAVASFFPTAKELSSGVQWFKDHPVLAAAAATAVSVITYLNALELEAEAEVLDEPSTSPSDVSSVPNRHRKPAPIRRRGSPSSDGKLSAAVSWCDEHGGSLTQVFEEEESDSDDEARDDVAESFESAFQQHRALTGGLRKSVTTQQLEVVAVQSGSDAEADVMQTDSPQWGWYVPITPPQDQFQSSSRDSAAVAPCHVVGPAAVAPVDVKTMRRTTSGHVG
jgi:hypothetical protein